MKTAALAITLGALTLPSAALAGPTARLTATAQAAKVCHQIHGHSAYCHAREHRHAIRVVSAQVYRQESRAHVQHWRRPRLAWNLNHLAHQNHNWRVRLRMTAKLPTWHSQNPVTAIMQVFGSNGRDAIRVFTCESGLSTRAVNGQYLGLAQMGEYARAKYGHGSDVWTQVIAAHSYFMDSGWSPWSCAYITGVI